MWLGPQLNGSSVTLGFGWISALLDVNIRSEVADDFKLLPGRLDVIVLKPPPPHQNKSNPSGEQLKMLQKP